MPSASFSSSRRAALKDVVSLQQLLSIVQQETSSMDYMRATSAFTRAANIIRRSSRQQLQQQAEHAALQQLRPLLHQLADRTKEQNDVRGLANIIWSCVDLCDTSTAQLLLLLFLQDSKLHEAVPQDVSNVLWAAAELELQLNPQQVWIMLRRLTKLLPQAKPQEIANALLAVAKLGQQVPPKQLQQFLSKLTELLLQVKPQEMANTVWAVATMGQRMLPEQLQHLLSRLMELLPQATPQHVSNTLWACAKMQHVPLQLLSAVQQHQKLLQAFIAQALASMAWACGQLGYRSKVLPGVLLQQAAQMNEGDLNMQGICNLCWSAAVLDMRECVPQVLQLAGGCCRLWDTVAAEELRQLYQVHLWLLDSQLLLAGQGLSGALTQHQLEQCRASWEQQLAVSTHTSKASQLQRSVFAAAQQLPPGTWQQPPAMEQRTADGALSIDIAGTTAGGVQVAIELDGPHHFVDWGRDKTLNGPSQSRNRSLTARGYCVISIPHWEWRKLSVPAQQQQYLLDKLSAAVQQQS